jgi:hypothetical protein
MIMSADLLLTKKNLVFLLKKFAFNYKNPAFLKFFEDDRDEVKNLMNGFTCNNGKINCQIGAQVKNVFTVKFSTEDTCHTTELFQLLSTSEDLKNKDLDSVCNSCKKDRYPF